MSYFTTAFIQFFKDLALNNNSEWFHQNKKTYEKEVKEPFARFVDEMISRIKKYEPDINIRPSDAIMRINNDIRFSKDKTPYKTHVAANISLYGKKDKGYPGFYLQLSHEGVIIYGGVYMVDNPTLHKIRLFIVNNHETLSLAINDQTFKTKYCALQGEKNKRLPAELQQFAGKEPLIANKQFYFGTVLPAELITKSDLADTLMEYYLAGKGVNSFFQEAYSESLS